MPDPRLRVVQIVSGLDIGGIDGGREKFAVELAGQLRRLGVGASVCAFWQRGTPAEARCIAGLLADGIGAFHAAGGQARFSAAGFRLGIRALAARCQGGPVILHSHYQMGTLAALWLKWRGLPARCARTVHTSGAEWEPGLAGWCLRQIFTNAVFPLGVDAETAVSRAGADRLQRRPLARFARRPAAWIPNGIRAEYAATAGDPPAAIAEALAPGDIAIGAVGRLSRQKGLIHLIDALPGVLAREPRARLIVVGDGELRASLQRRAAELGVAGRAVFTGQLDDVAAALKRFDLLALPSLWEGLPTVALEAMACGVPVIATDIPGTRELIRHGVEGWLVPPADPAALAEAIVMAIQAPGLAAGWAMQARQVAARFSMESIARAYLGLYRELQP
jgi:glycosyltransferase involved in cell wall biosynthesis